MRLGADLSQREADVLIAIGMVTLSRDAGALLTGTASFAFESTLSVREGGKVPCQRHDTESSGNTAQGHAWTSMTVVKTWGTRGEAWL